MTLTESSLTLEYLNKTFSKQQLAALYRVSKIHLKFLDRVKEILIIEESGMEKVYFVDFQEIFTYGYPYSGYENTSEPVDFVSVRYLFDNAKNTKFVIPDGAVWELVQHYEFLSKKLEISTNISKIIEQNLGRSLKVFLEADKLSKKDHRFIEASILEPVNTKDLASKVIILAANHIYAAKRMEKFIISDNITNLRELGLRLNKSQINDFQELYWTVYEELGGRRPEYIQSNVADARNIVWTAIARHNFVNEKQGNYYPILLTHTDPIFKIQPKVPDRFTRYYGFDSSLVWNPATAVYTTVIDHMDVPNKVDWINNAIGICQNLQSILDPLLIDVEKKITERHFSQDINFILSLSKEELYLLNKALKPFFDYAINPYSQMFKELERIWRENAFFKEDRLITSLEVQEKEYFQSISEDADYSSSLLDAKERLKNLHLTISKLLSFKTVSDKKAARGEFLEFTIEDLGYKSIGPEEKQGLLSYQLIKVDNHANGNVLKADINLDKNYGVFQWGSGTSIRSAIKSLNSLLQREIGSGNKFLINDKKNGNDIYLQGAIAYMIEPHIRGNFVSREEAFFYKLPISICDLFECNQTKALSFLRINTPIADFCFYTRLGEAAILDYQDYRLHKIGVITNHRLPNIIADFFEYTTHTQIGSSRLKDFLHEPLGHLKGRRKSK